MNLISVLGMVTLVGLAWAMSAHRTKVNIRTVIWGLGLQFLLAVIILREDFWSFAGMAVFGGLLVAYMMRANDGEPGGGWKVAAAVIVGGSAVGYVFGRFLGQAIPLALLITLGFLLVNAKFRFAREIQRYVSSLLVILGVTYLVSRDLNGQEVFSALTAKVSSFLNLSDYGAKFLFGNLADAQHFFPADTSMWHGFGFLFAFKVLPTIVFFGGFMALLYHLGIMQIVIENMARFMRWTIGTSGAETLSCSANIFVGQTEAPLLIKPFLEKMTNSELSTIMVGGFATIAGGVLAGYIAMGIPAGHLIAASVMSAPAALVIGKIIYPETEHSETAGDVKLPDLKTAGNAIEATANGITDGLKLAVNVGAMLLGFIALIAVFDVLLNWADSIIDGRLLHGAVVTYSSGGMSPITSEFVGIFPGSLQTFFGTVLKPLAWLMGVPWEDAAKVGNLLGIKLSLNEFVSYGTLGTYIQDNALSDRAVIISTYALCGFANFSSIGIQIGGIAALAPSRKSDLAKVGLKAMLGGAIASWLTATIAGMLVV
ncbi:MAG: nucleoside transporter C-terminal domain-containing protein [Thermoanaerobaculia bacterium]